MKGFLATTIVSLTVVITWLSELRYRKETESLVLCTRIHSWYLSRPTVVSFFERRARKFGLFWSLLAILLRVYHNHHYQHHRLHHSDRHDDPHPRKERWGYWEVLPTARTGRSRVPAVPHQVCPVCKLPNLSIKMSQICQISLLPLPTKDRLRVADT